MFCSKCGTEIPDESNFCWKCGKPQKPGVLPTIQKYEKCEIVWHCVDTHFFGSDDLKFWAKAIGKNGSYNAGTSDIFKGSNTHGPFGDVDEHADALNALIKKLVNDGWEPTGDRGQAWFSIRFQRVITE